MTITREHLEKVSRSLMAGMDRALTEEFGARIGITLFLSPIGDDVTQPITYISNVDRADMIRTVEIWLENAKSGLTSDPRGPRAEG